ncbi:MAG: glycosyltransferase [Nitrososphaerales archaeon]
MGLQDQERPKQRRRGDPEPGSGFTIGICATGSSPRLADLLAVIREEPLPRGFSLSRIVVVASACAPSTVECLRLAEASDPRMVLVEEGERKGKADAVNQVISQSVGEYLVFVNSDALPERGAISRLLRAMDRDPSVGVVCGNPVIADRRGLASGVIQLMWTTHNLCTEDLQRERRANHGTDELMVVRSGALASLPEGVVNDGAYLAGVASLRGYEVRSLASARVDVEAPTRPVDVIRQRRRILYGHIQVWRLVGRPPRTVESLVLLSPLRAFRLVVMAISNRPRLLLALPFATVGEAVSFLGALADSLGSGRKHAVWRRFGA